MRTIHLGLRVADADRSIAFHAVVGYEMVPDPDHDQGRGGGALSHLVIATESMDDTIAELTARGIDVQASTSPDGYNNFLTTSIGDLNHTVGIETKG